MAWQGRCRGGLAAAVAALAAALLVAFALPAASGAGEPAANAPPGAASAPRGAPPAGAPAVIAITPEPPKPDAPPTAAARAAGARTGRGSRTAGPRLSPAEIKAAQHRLTELGYWAGAASGPWDATWRHALIAFQKVEWRKPTGVLTRAEWDAMLPTNPPAPRETGPAHIEVDLARQVLFMVDDAGVVSHILPISTGS
ncbi:MAG TPA: peptidoglycan-binding domain-containing protein, partial [Thermoanaerobaculia bacterium]|nr:peptidoglycan-binding domain-containing protein [Thermoanaerobaculia bacterium]